MTFVTLAALAVALFVGAPLAAHLLRRRRSEERPFPAAALVPATPPTARRRSNLEDRLLFALRALSILALAVLGATPFVRCNRLALTRQTGASVALAIVLDDSLSMRAHVSGPGSPTRFERAKTGAAELVRGLTNGDAVAIVLGGAPARVALAASTDLASVAAAIEAATPSDRATDLDSARRMGADLLEGLPQIDKRVVLLSDLADGEPSGAPLAGSNEVALWAPLPEIEAKGEADCAVVRAERAGLHVRVRVACTPALPVAPPANASAQSSASGAPSAAPAPPDGPSAGRSVQARAGERVLRTVPLGPMVRSDEIGIDLPTDAPAEGITITLTGTDAIASDDAAPVSAQGEKLKVALVVDTASVHVETGGASPVEQALAALSTGAETHPLPTVPDHVEELSKFGALLVDDAPGFTPETRRATREWVEKGGVLLLTLGPKAAAAPLGASFDPLVPGVVRWGPSPDPGIDPASFSMLGASARSLADLAPRGRASLDAEALQNADILAKWKDGAPFLLRRSLGRGAVLALTLPLATDESDLALRPAFLALLDRFVRIARARGGSPRVDAGDAWIFDGVKTATVLRLDEKAAGDRTPIPLTEADRRLRAVPPLAGLYEVTLDGERELRVATVPEQEIDLRPRALVQDARDARLGGAAGAVDVSAYVALALLLLATGELALRVRARSQESA